MNITDRIKTIEGIEDAYWDGGRDRLTVYYLQLFPLDVIKVRVAAAIADVQLQDSVKEITLISV